MEREGRCKTKYPILLLHGINSRDDQPGGYFGRIPEALRREGAAVYLGGQDAWGTVENNARQIQRRMGEMLAEERCEKINIIAHSKGGLEARYLAAALGEGARIASISTVSTPHRGNRTAAAWTAHKWLLCPVGAVYNLWWRRMGDGQPAFAAVLCALTPDAMEDFNQRYPDVPAVFYQSWGTSLNESREDFKMGLYRRFFYGMDGENDGLISPLSARWGQDNGIIEGVSHQDIVDCRKRDFSHFSTVDFYREMVQGLVEKGF